MDDKADPLQWSRSPRPFSAGLGSNLFLAVTPILAIILVLLFLLPLSSTKTALPSLAPVEPHSEPAASKAIAITPDGLFVLAVNPFANTLSLIPTNSGAHTNGGAARTGPALAAEIAVGVSPQAVAVSPDGSVAYVANKGDNSVSVVDLAGRRVTAQIPVGDRPVGVLASADGRFLVVAEYGADKVRFLDPADLHSIAAISVSDRPFGMAISPDGRYLFVSHLLDGAITVLPMLPYRAYLPMTFGQSPSTSPAVSSNLSSPPPSIATWPHIAPAPSVVVNAAGTRLYLPQTMANGQGLNTQFDNTVFPKVSVINLETWSHQTDEHVSLPETDRPVGLPWDVTLAQDGRELWVVNAASNDLSVIDISNPTTPQRRAHLILGHNPRGIILSPDGTTAYANNTLSGSVSVIDTEAYTVTAVITTTDIPLPPRLLTGARLFYSSARPDVARAAWISCNTCHIEGEHDGRTWLLQYLDPHPVVEATLTATPVITRNTTSLLGMIETYPLRWSAEWDESADSEFSIRFEQFGTGLIDGDMHPTLGMPNQGRSDDLDSLAAFIDSLALPGRSAPLTAAGERGRAIFNSPVTKCADCHPPPLFTDLTVHDVGTARGAGELHGPYIDTPTLRFLYDSAPYLHDGSAATLKELLTTANPTDEHGVTGHLTAAEIDDLVAFLLALPTGE